MRADTPSVATLGRRSQAAVQKAAALLEVVDQAAAAKVKQAALDEIFVGQKPILMGVEPESFYWFQGTLSKTRDGKTWAAALARLPSLEYAVTDAGSGLLKGVQLANQTRSTTDSQKRPVSVVRGLSSHMYTSFRRRPRIVVGQWRPAEQMPNKFLSTDRR